MRLIYLSFIILTTSIVCRLTIIYPQNSYDAQIFVHSNQFIHAQISSEEVQSEMFQTIYLKLVEVGRSKRKTYDNFIRKCKKFIERLVKSMLVPNGKSVTQSSIGVSFINKKRLWQFSRYYEIRLYQAQQQMQIIDNIVAAFKLIRLKYDSGDIKERRLKQRITQTFLLAKIQLTNFLRKFGGNVIIKELAGFQVQGFKQYSITSYQQYNQKPQNSQSSSSNRNKSTTQQNQRLQSSIPKSDPNIDIRILAKFQITTIQDQIQYQKNEQEKLNDEQVALQSDAQEEDSQDDPSFNQDM